MNINFISIYLLYWFQYKPMKYGFKYGIFAIQSPYWFPFVILNSVRIVYTVTLKRERGAVKVDCRNPLPLVYTNGINNGNWLACLLCCLLDASTDSII
jgi:hypothetical protein